MLGVRDGYQNDAACTAVRAVRCPIVDGRTQWMVLSATINNPEVASCLGGKAVRTEVYCVSLSQNTASS